MSLTYVARRLNSPQVDRAVLPFREVEASVRRSLVLIAALAWAGFWSQRPGTSILIDEAVRIVPWLLGMTLLNSGWALFLRFSKLRHADWPDAVGAVSVFAGVAICLHVSWNLMLPFVAVLPLAAISTGARFSRSAFVLAVIASAAIVFFAAPSGYWGSRPAVAMLAMGLIAGLPFTAYRLMAGLREISEQAIIARDAQTRFVASVSHELRTPLSAITTAAKLFDASQLDDSNRGLIRAITTNGATLAQRIDDVLDVAAISAGQMQLVSSVFSLRRLMRTVNEIVLPSAMAKSIHLSLEVADDLPTLVGDPGRIEQVITNLAANAVKFTPAGGRVHLHARMIGSADGSATVFITVSDNGVGIPDELKATVFQPFMQASAGMTKRHPGVGLGLHIVRTLSDYMSGQLEVRDNPGGGTVFAWRLTLPMARADAPPEPTGTLREQLETHRSRSRSLRVLVVDDTASNRDIIGLLLQRLGHTPVMAEDGYVALPAIRAKDFDLILLDLSMPGISGLEVLRELRVSPGLDLLPPIAVVSAITDAETISQANQLGAFAYLKKPLNTDQLIHLLEEVSDHQPAKAKPAEALSPLEIMRALAEPAAVTAFIRSVIDDLQTYDQQIDTLLQHGPMDDIPPVVHRLKNSILSYAPPGAASVCEAFTNEVRSGRDVRLPRSALKALVATTISELMAQPEYSAPKADEPQVLEGT